MNPCCLICLKSKAQRPGSEIKMSTNSALDLKMTKDIHDPKLTYEDNGSWIGGNLATDKRKLKRYTNYSFI